MYYTIQTSDINQSLIRAFGRSWLVVDFIGRIMAIDVGKRCYLRSNLIQVENDAQMKARLAC